MLAQLNPLPELVSFIFLFFSFFDVLTLSFSPTQSVSFIFIYFLLFWLSEISICNVIFSLSLSLSLSLSVCLSLLPLAYPSPLQAGYRMMSVVDPALCRRVALRYSLLMTPLSLSAPLLGKTYPLHAFPILRFKFL